MAARWSIAVDTARCGGTGLCVGIAPEHFRLDERRRSRPRTGLAEPDPAVLDAAECCPTEAIHVTDLATGRPPGPDGPDAAGPDGPD